MAIDSAPPYADSIAWRTVRDRLDAGKTPRVAMLDIDGTLTGNAHAADRVRAMLERGGYVVTFNTSRTEEMLMTRGAYDASRASGRFHRPPPHLGREGNRRIEVPQESAEPIGLLNPDIIAGSTGTRILVRQHDGSYLPDQSYGSAEVLSPPVWRQQVEALLADMNRESIVVRPAPIEDPANYDAGISDVFPPDYRVQLDLDGRHARTEALARLHGLRRGEGGIAARVRIIDDSEPREDRYKAFVLPRWASKARASQHILGRIRGDHRLAAAQPEVLFVGDSYPDLHMALVGGAGVRATLLLVGRSRLTDVLWDQETTEFAGESLRAVKHRLRRDDRPGHLRYHPACGRGSLSIVLGDVAFPGSVAAETVERYLRGGTG